VKSCIFNYQKNFFSFYIFDLPICVGFEYKSYVQILILIKIGPKSHKKWYYENPPTLLCVVHKEQSLFFFGSFPTRWKKLYRETSMNFLLDLRTLSLRSTPLHRFTCSTKNKERKFDHLEGQSPQLDKF